MLANILLNQRTKNLKLALFVVELLIADAIETGNTCDWGWYL